MPTPRRILVMGRAKTGTTALAHLVRDGIAPADLLMEPQSSGDVQAWLAAGNSEAPGHGKVVKVLFDHFHLRQDELIEIAASFDVMVAINRDVRDEMVSRLLFMTRTLLTDGHPRDFLKPWIAALDAKCADPASQSFLGLCNQLGELTGQPVLRSVVYGALWHAHAYRGFLDRVAGLPVVEVSYEDLVDGRAATLADALGLAHVPQLADVATGRFGYTRRSAGHGAWRHIMRPYDVQWLADRMAEQGMARIADWQLAPQPHLDPKNYGGYVAELAGQKQRLRNAVVRTLRSVRSGG